MNETELLRQIRIVLSHYTPVVNRNRAPQVPPVQTSTKRGPPQQPELPVRRKKHQVLPEGVPPSPQRDPAITDKGDTDRTFQNPQFFNQDEKPSSKAVSIRVRCRLWLEARLSEGPVPLAEVLQEATMLGFSNKALRMARIYLKVQAVRCISLPQIDTEEGMK